MSKFRSRTVAIATFAALGSSLVVSGAHAQTAQKPGLMHRLLHRNTPTSGGATSRMSGNIVGNKKTHVFHMPGDKGQLPASQNRVYFRTADEARAAGYHQGGQMTTHSRSSRSTTHTRNSTGMMHSRNTMGTSHRGNSMDPMHSRNSTDTSHGMLHQTH